jgi:hypothetical protein
MSVSTALLKDVIRLYRRSRSQQTVCRQLPQLYTDMENGREANQWVEIQSPDIGLPPPATP